MRNPIVGAVLIVAGLAATVALILHGDDVPSIIGVVVLGGLGLVQARAHEVVRRTMRPPPGGDGDDVPRIPPLPRWPGNGAA